MIKSFYKSLFFNTRIWLLVGVLASAFVLAYFFAFLLPIVQMVFWVLMALLVLDILLLYALKDGLLGTRELPDRFSNGDSNPIFIDIKNKYSFVLWLDIIDEIPVQFQVRDTNFRMKIKSGAEGRIKYELRPTERGEYHFGGLNVYATSLIGLIRRRYTFSQDAMVPVYPSFLQMRKYQFMAISHRLTDVGVKKVRRLGHSAEFEQIKEYVRGDDHRTVNWKATARSNKLMVNQYTDTRSQNVYCLVDMSRNMKMPFEGMSLLDYGINASLVMSNIALFKHDKPGLITFSEKINTYVPADNRNLQMNRILHKLYNQETQFLEADYGRIFSLIRNKIAQRSLLILFTNFESVAAMRRQLPYLQKIARNHLLVVIFFENTELKDLLAWPPQNTEEIYIKSIAENFAFQKRQIVRELEHHGIIAILSSPQALTVNTINKYLEIKARGML